MSTHKNVATALKRVATLLTKRPHMGLHEDAMATAIWQGGTRMASFDANGTRVDSDMPSELGGNGNHVSPGWLFRAGVASCVATTICMVASSEGIELDTLEVRVGSSSDTRGLLGIVDGSGERVYPGLAEIRLEIDIHARGIDPAALQNLVHEGLFRSPMHNAITRQAPIVVRIDAGETRGFPRYAACAF